MLRWGWRVGVTKEDTRIRHQLIHQQLDGAHRLLALRPRVREKDVEAAVGYRVRRYFSVVLAGPEAPRLGCACLQGATPGVLTHLVEGDEEGEGEGANHAPEDDHTQHALWHCKGGAQPRRQNRVHLGRVSEHAHLEHDAREKEYCK